MVWDTGDIHTKPTTELNDSDVYDISINKLCFFLVNCKPFDNSGCKYSKRVRSELSLFFLHIDEVKAIWSAADNQTWKESLMSGP